MLNKIAQVAVITVLTGLFATGHALAEQAGDRCQLQQPAKLFLGQSGKAFSTRLSKDAVVTLKKRHSGRWLVEAGSGQIGYLEAFGDRHRHLRRCQHVGQQKEPAWRINQKPSAHGGTLAYLAPHHESAVAVKIDSRPNPEANKRYTPVPQ